MLDTHGNHPNPLTSTHNQHIHLIRKKPQSNFPVPSQKKPGTKTVRFSTKSTTPKDLIFSSLETFLGFSLFSFTGGHFFAEAKVALRSRCLGSIHPQTQKRGSTGSVRRLKLWKYIIHEEILDTNVCKIYILDHISKILWKCHVSYIVFHSG